MLNQKSTTEYPLDESFRGSEGRHGGGTLREAYDPKYIGRRARRPIVK